MKHLFTILFMLAFLARIQAQTPTSTTFTYSGTIETWTVPTGVTSLTIEARGAEGGSRGRSTFTSGLGATIVGTVSVTPGQSLSILVGQRPRLGNGGGGGSFVVGPGPRPSNPTPLVIAGGGGGDGNVDNSLSKQGQADGNGGKGGGIGGGSGGTGGNGGTTTDGDGYNSFSGGGFYTNGTGGGDESGNGRAFVNGGSGGDAIAGTGFGGGGGGAGSTSGGGGGGYSGGGGGDRRNNGGVGGGGGSFNAGTSKTNTAGANSGNGLVIISYICPGFTPTLASSGTLTCAQTSVTLTAGGGEAGATYQFTGQTAPTSSPSISVSASGPYSVTVTNPGGCSAIATKTVAADRTPPPAPTLTNDGPLTCTKRVVTLTAGAGGGGPYTFSAGATATGPSTATVTAEGTYRVTVTGANGCTAIQTTQVLSNTLAPQNVTLSNDGPLTCAKTSVNLTAGSTTTGVSYVFTGPEVSGSTSNTATVSQEGTYSVKVTGANGCTAIKTTQVISNTVAPAATLFSSGTLTCTNTTVTLTAGGGGTYSFGLGATQQNPPSGNTATVSQEGTYSVKVTGTNGCTATQSTQVFSNTAAPNATLTNTGPLSDSNPTVTLNVTGGGSYQFSQGAVQQVNSSTATVTTPGIYSVTVTRADNGCTATASTTVTGGQNPAPVCRNGTAVVSVLVSGSPVRYEWYRNGTNTARLMEIPNFQRGTNTASLTLINQQTTANYFVRVTDASGSSMVYGPIKVTVNTNCNANARLSTEEVGLQITVLGNPINGEQLRAVIGGAAGKALNVQLLDLSGKPIRQQAWQQAESDQLVEWSMSGQASGVYLLEATTPGGRQRVKVVKP